MENGTCSQDGCDSAVKARGVCNAHYLRLGRAGELPPKQVTTEHHKLTNVDTASRTANCSVCGPTQIRIRSGRRGHQCMTKRAEDRFARAFTLTTDDRRRWKYGLSRHELDALVARAADRCEICNAELNGDYHIDHCHQTGIVRGVLCKRCNYALGWLDDNPGRALTAYMYLKAHGK